MLAITEWRFYLALVDSGYTLVRATILAHRDGPMWPILDGQGFLSAK
jgi:hypothetical protein